MSAAKKIAFSFLLSVFLFAGVVFFIFGGIPDSDVGILLFTGIFLTLFLMIFLCFNIRQDMVDEQAGVDFVLKIEPHDYEELEELEAVDAVCAIKMPTVSEISAMSGLTQTASIQSAELEDINGSGLCLFSRPFAFLQNNPETLHAAGNEVIYEQNGIHYIDSLIDTEDGAPATLDNNFIKLVESVMNKGNL